MSSTTSPIATLKATLAADRAALLAAVERVPADLRSTKPADGRWSVQDVVEHLSLVEGRAGMLVGALVAEAPALDGATDGPTAINRVAMANRDMKVSAPDPIQPTGRVSIDAAISALGTSRAALLAAMEQAEGRDLSKVSRPHPALGLLDGYQWIGAIGGHEMRHTLQIEEIRKALVGG